MPLRLTLCLSHWMQMQGPQAFMAVLVRLLRVHALATALQAQLADADTWRQQVTVRRSLLLKWAALPMNLAGLGCFLCLVSNAPVRRLMFWVLKHEPLPQLTC